MGSFVSAFFKASYDLFSKSRRLILAIVLYLFFLTILYVWKPEPLYDYKNEQFRRFGLGTNGTTSLLGIEVVLLLSAILSYLIAFLFVPLLEIKYPLNDFALQEFPKYQEVVSTTTAEINENNPPIRRRKTDIPQTLNSPSFTQTGGRKTNITTTNLKKNGKLCTNPKCKKHHQSKNEDVSPTEANSSYYDDEEYQNFLEFQDYKKFLKKQQQLHPRTAAEFSNARHRNGSMVVFPFPKQQH